MQIVMPRLGLTMTEATLAEWLKREGEAVRQGEIMFLFESEKATMEYESPQDGVLRQILVQAGETVPCGAPVALLETGDQTTHHRPLATPAAKRRARELGVELAELTGRGPGGRIQAADVEAAALQSAPSTAGSIQTIRPSRPSAHPTPLAARLAADLGVDLTAVAGSGPGGRITRQDVIAAARARGPAPGAASPAAPAVPTIVPTRAEPLRGVRAVIARRMAESASTAAHVTLHTEADATALAAAREQLNAELAPNRISYNTLLVALAARALRDHPYVNSCLVGEEILLYQEINVALAVDAERGLLAPVIRHADQLDLASIQRATDALIGRALAGRSLPEDLTGGTFTITNLGAFEIDAFTPIINQPQAAILGVGRILSRPVDVGGEVGLRKTITLSLSFDHRILDGAPAARFLQRLKQLVERPFALAVPPP